MELIREYNLDGVCLQETIRSRLTDRELQNLSGGDSFGGAGSQLKVTLGGFCSGLVRKLLRYWMKGRRFSLSLFS